MGLFSAVLLLPLAPLRGVEWVAGRLLDTAESEFRDPAMLRARLGELNRAYEEGEISEEEFEHEEERLLDLLEHRTPAVVTHTSTRSESTADEPSSPSESDLSQGTSHGRQL